MNHDHNHDQNQATIDRRLELILDRALQGLSPAEQAELARFAPTAAADLEIELVAAAVALARVDLTEQPDLPADLAARIERQAIRSLGAKTNPVPTRTTAPVRRGRRVAPWLGWVAAAAAFGVVLADRTTPRSPVSPAARPLVSTQDPLGGAPSARLVATGHPLARGASGLVVWDGVRQEGSLRVAGLAPVDPRSGCYQLWIFDASRDERYPVDGGTFTVAGAVAGQVVAVHPRIPVRQPTLFAITLEPPGGVVVSDRDRILLTAAWTLNNPGGSPRR